MWKSCDDECYVWGSVEFNSYFVLFEVVIFMLCRSKWLLWEKVKVMVEIF